MNKRPFSLHMPLQALLNLTLHTSLEADKLHYRPLLLNPMWFITAFYSLVLVYNPCRGAIRTSSFYLLIYFPDTLNV